MQPTPIGAPVIGAAGVSFSLADPAERLCSVRIEQDLGLRTNLDFTRRGSVWTLRMPRPPVDRMEYLLEITDRKGRRATITDPANLLRVAGPFGDKSVVRFPEYREPAWLAMAGIADSRTPLSIQPRAPGIAIRGVLWSPGGLSPAEPAPMLVVHDGPEYAQLGSFTHYLGALITAGTLPELRAALLAPGERNDWYSANPDYAAALCSDVVVELGRHAPTTVRIGVGVSLGALAMLHAHCSYPSTFDGLLLQSGSFFTPELDAQESGFSGYGPVTGFVAEVARGGAGERPVPTAMTCGGLEENLANNRAMAQALTRSGYPVDFHEVRDAHNFTAWRDVLHPTFTDLLRSVVGARAA